MSSGTMTRSSTPVAPRTVTLQWIDRSIVAILPVYSPPDHYKGSVYRSTSLMPPVIAGYRVTRFPAGTDYQRP
jgi:hypothetical protein